MKKIYTKPEIIFDSFELSQSIAAGCELLSSGTRETGCTVSVPGDFGETLYTFFAEGSCDRYSPAELDSLCYHAPADAYNVFSS